MRGVRTSGRLQLCGDMDARRPPSGRELHGTRSLCGFPPSTNNASSSILLDGLDAVVERAVDEAVPDERAVDASDSGNDRSVAVTERVWRRCCWP